MKKRTIGLLWRYKYIVLSVLLFLFYLVYMIYQYGIEMYWYEWLPVLIPLSVIAGYLFETFTGQSLITWYRTRNIVELDGPDESDARAKEEEKN